VARFAGMPHLARLWHVLNGLDAAELATVPYNVVPLNYRRLEPASRPAERGKYRPRHGVTLLTATTAVLNNCGPDPDPDREAGRGWATGRPRSAGHAAGKNKSMTIRFIAVADSVQLSRVRSGSGLGQYVILRHPCQAGPLYRAKQYVSALGSHTPQECLSGLVYSDSGKPPLI
jgi:hypothetical protein